MPVISMRRMPFLSGLVCVLLLVAQHAYAQTEEARRMSLTRYTPASPEASSIALYQSYPVDFVSGAPNIEIPLFDVPTRAGTIPFKLNYHIGKIKPSEHTSGPGFGWTLTPNLGVTRAIKGGMDGANTGYPANSLFGSTTDIYFNAASFNNLDEQPDDFYYSLLGKGGRFLYNRSGAFKTVDYDAVKILRPNDQQFIITDDDGTIYKFGRYSNLTQTVTETDQEIGIVSWKLTEIIPYDRSDTIRFIYSSQPQLLQMPTYNIQWRITEYVHYYDPLAYNTKPAHVYRSAFDPGTSLASGGLRIMGPESVTRDLPPPEFPPLDFVPPEYFGGTTVRMIDLNSSQDPKLQQAWALLNYGPSYATGSEEKVAKSEQYRLTEIQFKGGKVTLGYTGEKLNMVTLYEGSSIVKRAELFHHNLSQPSGEQPISYYMNLNTRFALNKVRLYGTNQTSYQDYQIQYTGGGSSIGVYANYGTDFWGFKNYNGPSIVPYTMRYVNSFVFPACMSNSSSDTACESPNLLYEGAWVSIGFSQERTQPFLMVPGIISKITYPTGGTAEFTFEHNQYPSPTNLQNNLYGGGFRIKQIDYKTGDQRDSISKRYKYGINEDGIGRVKYKNFYENFISSYYETGPPNSASPEYTIQKNTTISSKPHLDMSFASGAAVLYPEVTEYTVNPVNNKPLGKTVYEYVIDSKNDAFLPETPIQADQRNDWKVISFKSQRNYRYNESNGTYSLLNKTVNDYQSFYKDVIPAAQTFKRFYYHGDANDFTTPLPSQANVRFSHMNYNIITGARKLTTVTDTVYNPDNPAEFLVTVRTIDYDTMHLYKKSETLTDSRGGFRKTEYIYPYQPALVTGLTTAQQTLLQEMTEQNRISRPVETREYNNSTLLRTVQHQYAQYPNTRIYPSAVYASLLNNSLEKRLETSLYDGSGNVLEQRKADDVKEVYLWGYNKRFPVAKVLGSDHATVQGFVNQSILDAASSDAAIRTEVQKVRAGLASTNAQVYTYTFKPQVGVTSETDARGRTTYYEYDEMNRLHLVKDHDGNILKMICYNYHGQPVNCGPTVYLSELAFGNFTKNDCDPGYAGETMAYYVEEGAYTSLISQSDANTQAWNDVSANGQAYVNAHAGCYPSSLEIMYSNYKSGQPSAITFNFYNLSTSQQYTLTMPAWSTGGVLSGGGIPQGTYNVQIINPNSGSFTYTVGCWYSASNDTPLSITIHNVEITQTCPMVTIE